LHAGLLSGCAQRLAGAGHILDKVLDRLATRKSGQFREWLSVRYESKVDYRAIWTSLAVFSVILVAAYCIPPAQRASDGL